MKKVRVRVAVILLAGGSGSRMQTPLPKQFINLGDKPIFKHSLDVFQALPEVQEIIVVCAPQYRHFFLNMDIKFALPGPRRQDSVYSGLMEVSKDIDLVCVHDAARPFIDVECVKAVIEAASEHGAAMLATPLKFTVKQALADHSDFVAHTPDRALLWEAQTPQVISYDLLVRGFSKVNSEGLEVTDDVSLVELMGLPVKLIKGPYRNIKITTVEDLVFARSLHY